MRSSILHNSLKIHRQLQHSSNLIENIHTFRYNFDFTRKATVLPGKWYYLLQICVLQIHTCTTSYIQGEYPAGWVTAGSDAEGGRLSPAFKRNGSQGNRFRRRKQSFKEGVLAGAGPIASHLLSFLIKHSDFSPVKAADFHLPPGNPSPAAGAEAELFTAQECKIRFPGRDSLSLSTRAFHHCFTSHTSAGEGKSSHIGRCGKRPDCDSLCC